MGVVHLLVNPMSGRGRAEVVAEAVRNAADALGHDVECVTGRTVEDSVQAAHAAVAGGAERLIAIGGDGCLHIALQAVAGSDTVLGVVPAGTGNDFARAFGLNKCLLDQAAGRALGPDHLVDIIKVEGLGNDRAASDRAASDQAGTAAVGSAGGHPSAAAGTGLVRSAENLWIATSITGGFSVDVNKCVGRLPAWFGKNRYVIATLLTVPWLRHRRLVFTVDGQRHEFTTALWAVANAPTFGGGMVISPEADPRDGLLDLVVVGDVGRIALLRMLPTVFEGSHIHHRKVSVFRGRRIEVAHAVESQESEAADSSYHEVEGDGEPVGWLPVTATATPAALRFAAEI